MEAITLGGIVAIAYAIDYMRRERKARRNKKVKTLDSAQIAQILASREAKRGFRP